jgi:nucleoside-diphosphate-sugar epimerase
MKYIVFGSGFIGGALTRNLRADNHFVITVDRNRPRYSKHIGMCVHYIWKDISNLDNFPDQTGIDGVFQTCGMMPSQSTTDDELFTYNSNINKAVIKFCLKNNIKNVFFASSVWASNPIHPYGLEKLHSEGLFSEIAMDHNINVRIGRISNIYGPNSQRGIIHDICKKVQEAETSIVVRDPHNKRSFLHINDCVEAILKLMNSNIHNPTTIGSDQYYTIHDIAKKIIDVSGKQLTIHHQDNICSGGSYHIDISSILDIGWEPNVSIEEGIKQVYEKITSNENTTQ